MCKYCFIALLSVLLLGSAGAAHAQTFSFVQIDTTIHYTNADTVYEFHAHVHNLLSQTHTLLYSLTPVAFADTARNTSICTYLGCYPPHSGGYSIPQEYESLFQDDLVKFTVYNIISDWSQGFPMPVESLLVGDYIFDVTVANASNLSESSTARVSLLFGNGGIREVVTPLPTDAALITNFPNPFNPGTEIRFTLTQASPVQLAIYDMLGRRLETLADHVSYQPGTYSLYWPATAGGTPLPSGNYVVQLIAAEHAVSHRITLVR
jgi:hypothetical protein